MEIIILSLIIAVSSITLFVFQTVKMNELLKISAQKSEQIGDLNAINETLNRLLDFQHEEYNNGINSSISKLASMCNENEATILRIDMISETAIVENKLGTPCTMYFNNGDWK